jgi:hypothetical protein
VHTVVYNSLFSNVLLSLIRVLRFFAKNIFLFAISKVMGGVFEKWCGYLCSLKCVCECGTPASIWVHRGGVGV